MTHRPLLHLPLLCSFVFAFSWMQACIDFSNKAPDAGIEREIEASDASEPSMVEAGARDAGPESKPQCETDEACPPMTTQPSDCSKPSCEAGRCVYYTLDRDGDGVRARAATCQSTKGVPIVGGDDCDDERADVRPGAWDGPDDDGKPSTCNDGIDNDCSGSIDDGLLEDGTTCTCTPTDVIPCSLTTTGLAVDFPVLSESGEPLGRCKLGTQTCSDQGKWEPCAGLVGPSEEVCDHEDNDCDGIVDNARVLPRFRYDADGDGHGASWSKEVTGCFAPDEPPSECKSNQGLCPATGWTSTAVPLDDCDDAEAKRYPGAQEICNRRDDNCDRGGGVEEEEDLDSDGFTSSSYAGCQGGFPRTDCYDKSADVSPTQTKRFDVGYCLNTNAQIWCFTQRSSGLPECAKVDTCLSSIGQEWGPGSVDYNCDNVEEPLVATPAQAASYSQACAQASPPACSSTAAPAYTVAGFTCGAVSKHLKCTHDSSTGTCTYQSTFLMTACR